MNAAHVKAALSVPRAEREKDRAELDIARLTDASVECFEYDDWKAVQVWDSDSGFPSGQYLARTWQALVQKIEEARP